MAGLGFDALVCDMDGVIYRGDEPIPGSVHAVERMRDSGTRILFFTNNSRSTVQQYIVKLERLGIPVEPPDILTSAVVTGEVLHERGWAGRTVFVVGGEGVRAAVDEAGLEIVPDDKGRESEVVVVGWDPDFTYARMREAALALRAGAALIATNDDASFPAPDGLWPGAGAVLASIETASGVRAEVMGKPNRPMMDAAARRLRGHDRIAVVGDRPDTDLAGGDVMGWTTILVLSGVTSRDALDSVRPVPDVVIDRLADLYQ
ncbi:MAG: HAD-IIA family hydrolase [Actinomycetota bacterium]